MADENLKRLPLESFHRESGAKFCSFAGWSMPISYPLGVLKEHLHVREHAGLFDISHMRLIEVKGEKATDFLNYALPLDATNLKNGNSQYNFLLNENAGIIDDLIATRLGEDRYMLAVNAGNAEKDYEILVQRNKDYNCQLTMLDAVFIALQGPESAAVCRDAGLDFVDNLLFMQGCEPKDNWFVTRSGYTGEDGFEFAVPASDAPALIEKLLSDSRVEWIGLGARDSLRLEAGLCLHGNDLNETISPFQAGLMWAIPKTIRESALFVGAKALNEQIAAGPTYKRVGLQVLGRQPLRADTKLYSKTTGEEVGYISSGGFGPFVNAPVAMGYVKAEYSALDTELVSSVRGKQFEIVVKRLPFAPQRYYKG